MSAPEADPPVIDSPAAAAQVLCDYFLANADRGDHAANDDLVTEIVHHIRTHQTSRHRALIRLVITCALEFPSNSRAVLGCWVAQQVVV